MSFQAKILYRDEINQNYGVPASAYDYTELANIYNQTRIDYIVPMPMNARRMEEYVTNYEIDLDASIVVVDENHEPLGISMLGVRLPHTWITRLGVVPNQRGRRLGSFLMDALIDQSRLMNAKAIQLEVIFGNDPAYRLFQKLGFKELREILVIRRPPSPPADGTAPLSFVEELSPAEIEDALLHKRSPGASWVEDSRSLLNAGQLRGLRVQTGSGATGWTVFQCTQFQIQHIVLEADPHHRNDLYLSLLFHIHRLFPHRDTKVENVPVDDPVWDAYQKFGYMVAFRRIEMLLTL